jgi:hypothetical protein
MIFHPLVLALVAASLSTSFMVVYASNFGLRILKRWDLQSGSESQLALERKTYLVSTFLGVVFLTELLSLFLFIFTADRLHGLFAGAMCAVGSLNVNRFGYPALLLKVIAFVLAGLWLILNRLDNRGYDYPLVKKKYGFLLAIAPVILAETAVQGLYFLNLKPDIITSCCGSLFSAGGSSLVSSLVSLPPTPMKMIFYVSVALTAASAAAVLVKGRGGRVLGLMSGVTFIVSLLSVLSFYSIYVYELPTHHCPFCLLQKDYGFIGYPFYGTLFAGTIAGLGAGLIKPFRSIPSLSGIVPAFQRKLALAALAGFLALAALVTAALLTSNLNLNGV